MLPDAKSIATAEDATATETGFEYACVADPSTTTLLNATDDPPKEVAVEFTTRSLEKVFVPVMVCEFDTPTYRASADDTGISSLTDVPKFKSAAVPRFKDELSTAGVNDIAFGCVGRKIDSSIAS